MNPTNLILLWFSIGLFYGFIQEKYPKFYIWFSVSVFILFIPLLAYTPTNVLDLGVSNMSNWWYIPMIVAMLIGNKMGKSLAEKLEELK